MDPHARTRRGLSLAGALFAALFLTQCSCSGGSGDVGTPDVTDGDERKVVTTLDPPPESTDGADEPIEPPVEDDVAPDAPAPAEDEVEQPQEVVIADPPRPEPVDDGATGAIVGRVVFAGTTVPVLRPLTFGDKESEGCCETPMDDTDRSVRVDASGGVMDAVVWIGVKGREANGAGQEFLMDQRCCRYEPHVLVVPQGATVRYENSDGVTHNVHTFARKNSAVNDNVAAGSKLAQEYERDEEIPVKCDIHPWMSAYVFVAESEFTALTGADGSFRIENVPVGEYTLKVWHEKLKKKERRSIKVEVTAGGETPIDVELK